MTSLSTAVVTGANGFIGSALVRKLLRRGYKVRALVGQDLCRSSLEGLDIDLRSVDITDAAAVREALIGGDYLFHAAACYRFWMPDPEVIYRVNVEGTRNVMSAAAELGYKKCVYTSSAATMSPHYPGCGAGEESVFDLRRFQGHYKSSKVMAEMAVLRMAARGLDVVTVNPTVPVGEGDRRPTPTGEMIVHFLNGRMKAYVPISLNIVDVEDVAEGHILALERGRRGERYILGGENLPMDQMLQYLSAITGIAAPRRAIPRRLLLLMGRINEFIANRITGRPPLVFLEAALHAQNKMHFEASKARRELGFDPAPARQALNKAVRWYVEAGYARRGLALPAPEEILIPLQSAEKMG